MARPPERSQSTRLLHFNPKLTKLVWGNVLTVRPLNTRSVRKQIDFREIIGILWPTGTAARCERSDIVKARDVAGSLIHRVYCWPYVALGPCLRR